MLARMINMIMYSVVNCVSSDLKLVSVYPVNFQDTRSKLRLRLKVKQKHAYIIWARTGHIGFSLQLNYGGILFSCLLTLGKIEIV